jgi:hypothetical protein
MKRIITAAALTAAVALMPQGLDAQQLEARPGAPREGIHVRGHWTIDIRDKDGTLVKHHEFHNELQFNGPTALAALLSGNASAGGWYLALGNVYSIEPNSTRLDGKPPAAVFKNLTVANPGGTLVLKGTVAAQEDRTITNVTSDVFLCPATVSPAACKTAPDAVTHGFSHKALTGIAVVKGQLIQIGVTFTFGPLPIL